MATMKAACIRAFGGPEVLSVETVPVPEPKADELVVKVHAASVNPIDYKMRSGSYPGASPDKLPMVLGRDVAGVIVGHGERANSFHNGESVYAYLGGTDRGGYAEYAVVRGEEAAHEPDGLSHAEAAAVPLAGLTAWQGLFEHGGLQPGQRLLVHGGSGGVGHFAVQLAKAKDAFVATTVSPGDEDFAHALGADLVIDYKAERFEERVGDIDLVLDLVGGETQERSWAVLKPGGIIVSTLQQPSETAARSHRARGTVFMVHTDAGQLASIGSLIAAGKIWPHVETTYRLAEAQAAQRQLEQGHVRGKVVLEVAP